MKQEFQKCGQCKKMKLKIVIAYNGVCLSCLELYPEVKKEKQYKKIWAKGVVTKLIKNFTIEEIKQITDEAIKILQEKEKTVKEE